MQYFWVGKWKKGDRYWVGDPSEKFRPLLKNALGKSLANGVRLWLWLWLFLLLFVLSTESEVDQWLFLVPLIGGR